MSDKRNIREMSEERTKLAVHRTTLANARTFNAWVRTGLSSVLAGLAIVNFIGNRESTNVYVVLIGMIFVATGIMVYFIAYINYRNNMKELGLESRRISQLLYFMLILTLAMIIAAVLIFGLLLYIRQN